MTNYLEIIELYRKFYHGREKYYHNFTHVWNMVIDGLLLLEDKTDRLKQIFTHAVGGHDAEHSNGRLFNDSENVKIALEIFDKYAYLGKDTQEHKMARTIIRATEKPYGGYKTIEEIVYDSGVNEEHLLDLQFLIEITRDLDELGIIGIESEIRRKEAFVGLLREKLEVQFTKKDLLHTIDSITLSFKQNFKPHTKFGKQWSHKNLEVRIREQLDFSKQAIELATK